MSRRAGLAGLAIAFAAALAGVGVFAGLARADALESLTLQTAGGERPFSVEVAATYETRERGLMYRRYMPADRGMLFEFDRDEPVAFWMKNTFIPLDMVFIARNGKVTRIVERAEPMSETAIPSGGPVAAVLELNGGVAAQIGLKVGDTARHPFFKP